jgi:hypothetical protein
LCIRNNHTGVLEPKVANGRQEACKKRENKSTRFGEVAATNEMDHLVRVIHQHEE